MRQKDINTFKLAGKRFDAWILVRDTNTKSLDYVGKPGYIPKPIDCKAKTAEKGPNAGLVVAFDATPPQQNFNPNKIAKAEKAWKEFLQAHNAQDSISLSSGISRYGVQLDRKSSRYGCVILNSSYLHGDYDLKDIISRKNASRNVAMLHNLHGQAHMRDPFLTRVMNFVNTQIGIPMVLHGAEAQYADHSDDTIHTFTPDGKYSVLSNEQEIRNFYTVLSRTTGNPKKYGVKKIDVRNSPSSSPGFEEYAVKWFERKFG